MLPIEEYKTAFLQHIEKIFTPKEPIHLYEPIQYILNLGGKRIRPILTLIATDIFGKDYHKALNAATAIEVFHNFSLIHDDIMDNASLRRGKPTVHQKWDTNVGILSGDAMLIIAYKLLEDYPSKIFQELVKTLSETALKVCEGQQMDMDFEKLQEVSIEAYMQMISYKTSVLIGAALQMGSIISETTKETQINMYNFGLNLGIAFQLQDDYLDTFGDASFGKKIGGDIIENKKTILYLKSLALSNEKQREELLRAYALNEVDNKIARVREIFQITNADKAVRQLIENYTQKALMILEKITIGDDKREYLKTFALQLMDRKI